jgi:hypothetical protein
MTTVKLQLEVGRCNGSMTVDIVDQDHMILYHWDLPEHYEVTFNTAWPNSIKIQLSNKQMGRDTEIDAQGNIVANKYVKLRKLTVAGLDVNPGVLYSICQYTPQGESTRGEIFWDRPGTVLITFDHATPMRWNLANNNLIEFRNE